MIGLDTIHSQVLSGDQIDSMSEHQLERMVGSVSVFYRVTPRHKLCIVKVRFCGNYNIIHMADMGNSFENGIKKYKGSDPCKT